MLDLAPLQNLPLRGGFRLDIPSDPKNSNLHDHKLAGGRGRDRGGLSPRAAEPPRRGRHLLTQALAECFLRDNARREAAHRLLLAYESCETIATKAKS